MNKSQLVEAIAGDSGLSKADAGRAVESFLTTVGKTLKKGDEVVITGFGKFSVVKRAARQGVNPRTGEKVKIKASKAPKFTYEGPVSVICLELDVNDPGVRRRVEAQWAAVFRLRRALQRDARRRCRAYW